MSTATVRTGLDSFVRSDKPTANAGTSKTTSVQGSTKYGYLYFKNPAPLRATVLSATLRLYSVGAWGAGTVSVTVQRTSAKWSESQLNWNNKPGVTGSAVTVTQAANADATEWAFDVTALVQALASGATNYGLRLSTSSGTERKFYSLNAGDHRPVLEVEWADAPDAPTELSPSGGAAVSLAKPVLLFNFHDVSGSVAMAACQVQINPTNSFTAPAFDSGVVATSDPQLDLSATTYAGIAAGGTAWWRVRVQDGAGLWSPWSTPTSFTQNAKATLTINNPGASPLDYVNDSTPEVFWTVAGGTQVAYRVIVADDANPTRPLVDTGRRTGNANSYTVPKGLIANESTTYRLTVRVWDNLTRVATPGDSVYLEAVRTFKFKEDPTTNPVTNVTAAQVASGQPHVLVQFKRSTAPDSFAVWRDGKLVEDSLDPADSFVSGTTYQYLDRAAAPNATHVWTVRAKVNGKQSPGAASPSYKYRCNTVWLTDFDSPTRFLPVVFDDGAQASFDMPEVSTTYRPIDGRAAVRNTQGQSGLEGSIAGRVTSCYGGSAATWAANLLWMKQRPENQLRLTIGGQNLRVVIGNVVIAPVQGLDPDTYPDDRAVSFDFWSLDGPKQ